MATDTSNWPTKEDVKKTLGLSLSQINNLIKARRLEVRMRKRPGLPPVGVVNPIDVEREFAKRQPTEVQAHVLPPESEETSGGVNPAQQNFIEAFRTMFEAIMPKLLPPPPPANDDDQIIVPVTQKQRVTLREAVALGHTADDLRARVKAGSLENVGTPHRYRFRRRDLDAL